jgi:exonuclease SbcC
MIRLTLKNFKCYQEKTFEFDKGFVLIEGQSGVGKTTILQAIIFVLYGKGKNLKMNGKSSCSVQLDYDDLIILRSKNPNKLVINDIIEGEEAQHIINKKFGDTFDVTSYISQTSLNSFILMNPVEKLEFLEKFAFKDIDLSDIKSRNKTEIGKRKDDLVKIIHNLELTSKIFQDMNEPITVEFPIKSKLSNYEKITKNEEIKLKNCSTRIKKLQLEIKKLQEEINDLKIFNTFIKDKELNIDTLTTFLDELSLQEQNIIYDDNILNDYKSRLKILLSKNNLLIKQKQYLENTQKLELMKNTEIEKYTNEVNNISNNLWKDYSKEECENIIKNTKDCLKDAALVTTYKNNLKDYYIDPQILQNKKLEKNNLKEQLEKFKKLYRQKFIYNCPSCNNNLQIINNKLSIYTDILTEHSHMDIEDINSKIITIEKQIKNLETFIITEENKLDKCQKIEKNINDIISEYEDELDEEMLTDDLENIKTYYNLQLKQENKLSEIQNTLSEEKFSTSFKIFLKDNNKLKLHIEDLENISGKNNEILTEEELRELIIKEEKNKDTFERLIEDKRKKDGEVLKHKKDIETLKNTHINKYQTINNEEEIKQEIKDNEKQIFMYEKDIQTHTLNLEQIEKYNRYIQDFEKYSNFKNKIIELENQEKEHRKKYNASILLKEKILEAESIAILNIIETINNHSQVYLDHFFPDNPILVKLQTFKETKKDNKPQITIDIDYKGMETDLTSLSGGELSRVILAFTLALSEIFNSPILLLDESTASLDQDSTTIVFDAIKENFKNKFVLIVAHQVVLGIFDKIIKIT